MATRFIEMAAVGERLHVDVQCGVPGFSLRAVHRCTQPESIAAQIVLGSARIRDRSDRAPRIVRELRKNPPFRGQVA